LVAAWLLLLLLLLPCCYCRLLLTPAVDASCCCRHWQLPLLLLVAAVLQQPGVALVVLIVAASQQPHAAVVILTLLLLLASRRCWRGRCRAFSGLPRLAHVLAAEQTALAAAATAPAAVLARGRTRRHTRAWTAPAQQLLTALEVLQHSHSCGSPHCQRRRASSDPDTRPGGAACQ
jgi:hypothetical protein